MRTLGHKDIHWFITSTSNKRTYHIRLTSSITWYTVIFYIPWLSQPYISSDFIQSTMLSATSLSAPFFPLLHGFFTLSPGHGLAWFESLAYHDIYHKKTIGKWWDFMMIYPLVMTNIAIENGLYSGSTHSQWWFSIAMLNYQRVGLENWKPGLRWFFIAALAWWFEILL